MYILAIDQGTTSTRVVLYDYLFNPIITTQKDLEQIYPNKGFVEHNAEQIFQDVVFLIKQNIIQSAAKLNTKPDNILKAIKSIGITNQRETIVIWNKDTGKPVHNAIVWQDRRTTEFCNNLKSNNTNIDKIIQDKTGLIIDPYFSASKINWLLNKYDLNNNPNIITGTIDSYLIFKLTNGQSHVTDITNASRTQLYNINSLNWDSELLELFNIPGNILPEVKNCTDQFGITDEHIFGAKIPITGVAGDQQAAAIGQLCVNPKDIKITYGTGSFALQNTGNTKVVSNNNLISTIAYKINNKLNYALEGSIFIAGATVQWLRDELKLIKQPHDTEQISKKLDKLNGTNGVYLIPAFTGLGAPYWQPEVRAAILGMSRDTSFEHIVRAGLEAVAYQTRDLLSAFKQDYNLSHSIKVDGGMTVNNWLLQFIADITRLDIIKPKDIESSVKGAAILAAIGSDVYKSLDDLPNDISTNSKFTAKSDNQISEKLYQGWQDAVNKIL